MRYTYPAIVHDDPDGLWCEFPDLEGCFTQGDDVNDLMFNAQEALEAYLLSEDYRIVKLKPPTDIRTIKTTESTFTILVPVDVDLSKANAMIEVTVTIPEWMYKEAIAHNLNLSDILQEAIIRELNSQLHI